MPHPFVVGEQYFDRQGEFVVLGIEGNRIRYKYVDNPDEHLGDITIKVRIYANILLEQRTRHPHQSAGYFRTLGFIAQQGDLQAEVPPQAQAGFEENYYLITGTRPILRRDGYFPVHIETTYDKWGPELRLYFPEVAGLEFPPDIAVRAGINPGQLRINNNKYWWQLVTVGFRLGTRHDAFRIRDSVPPSFRSDFDAGEEKAKNT